MTGARPRLVFHVGSHKTGTTALQRRFFAAQDGLARKGVIYPDPAPFFGLGAPAPTHSAIIRDAALDTAEAHERLTRFAADLADRAQNGEAVFLSTETAYRVAADGIDWADGSDYWNGRHRLLERLAVHFAAFDLEFLLCLRRPDGLAESHFAESAAATGASWSFADFIGLKSYRYAYRRQVDLFRSIAPTQVLQYEAARQTGLIATFCDVLGISSIGEPDRLIRQSLSVRAQCWMQRSKASRDLLARDRNRRWLFALERDVASPFDGHNVTQWESATRRRDFVASALHDFTEVAFTNVTDDLPEACRWGRSDQARADRSFADWQERHISLLEARERAGLRPFEPGDPLEGTS